MIKPVLLITPAAVLLASCSSPADAPPPYFTPNPPEAPGMVDPYQEPGTGNAQPDVPPLVTPLSPAPNQQVPSPRDYPLATRTDRPNIVLSPYPPYDEIDVSDFRSGQLARDPRNKQIFRVP